MNAATRERFADGLFLPECPRWQGGALWLPATLLRVRPDGRVDVVAEDLLAPKSIAPGA